MVESQREIEGKISKETRFYITLLTMLANMIGPMIRNHWAIENGLRCWLCLFATANEGCEPTTPRPTSQARSRWPPASFAEPLAKTPNFSSEKLPGG